MTLPPDDYLYQKSAQESDRLSRARRRRARRMLVPAGEEGRSELLSRLSRQAYPSYEFFLFAVLCGALLGAGYILDSQALLFFGILLAPLMTPWAGLTLATVTGSVRFFLQTFAAMLVSSLLIFASGVLAGFAARIWLPLTLTQTFVHSRLWWPDLAVLAVGSILLTVSFVRSEEKPVLPSVMLAYELFLPLNAGGVGLGSGVGDIWPQGLLVFATHLALAILFSGLTLVILGFRPLRSLGYPFAVTVLLITLALLVELTGLGGKIREQFGLSSSTSMITSKPVGTSLVDTTSLAPTLQSGATHFPSPIITQVVSSFGTPSPTRPLNLLLPPSSTATITITPQPKPVYALVHSNEGGGATVRSEPAGAIMVTLENGDRLRFSLSSRISMVPFGST